MTSIIVDCTHQHFNANQLPIESGCHRNVREHQFNVIKQENERNYDSL